MAFVVMSLHVFSQVIPDMSTLKARAPATFRVEFHTSKGDFEVEVVREWSPEGADRFFQLVQTGFYQHNYFFRVQKDYVIQFGICDNREVNAYWDKHPVYDEPVMTSNKKGTISYARDGKNTRTTQIFINLKDNFKLDTVNYNGLRGFPPFARITRGYEVVEKFYSGYGFEPANHQDSVMVQGNKYWREHFPLVDSINSVVSLY